MDWPLAEGHLRSKQQTSEVVILILRIRLKVDEKDRLLLSPSQMLGGLDGVRRIADVMMGNQR